MILDWLSWLTRPVAPAERRCKRCDAPVPDLPEAIAGDLTLAVYCGPGCLPVPAFDPRRDR